MTLCISYTYPGARPANTNPHSTPCGRIEGPNSRHSPCRSTIAALTHSPYRNTRHNNYHTHCIIQRVPILFRIPTAAQPQPDLAKRNHQETSHPKPIKRCRPPQALRKFLRSHAATSERYAHHIATLSTSPSHSWKICLYY